MTLTCGLTHEFNFKIGYFFLLFFYRKGWASCLIIISLLWLCMVYPCTGLARALPLSVSLHRGSTILMRLIGSPVKSEIAASFHHPARWNVPLGFQNIIGSETSADESLSQHTLDVDPPLSWNRATPQTVLFWDCHRQKERAHRRRTCTFESCAKM